MADSPPRLLLKALVASQISSPMDRGSFLNSDSVSSVPNGRPRILLLTMEPPRMPGSGGEVRTFYFVKALAEFGDVTLVSLGGGENRRIDPGIAQACKRIIQPPVASPNSASQRKPSRLASWMRTAQTLLAPWRNGWGDFLGYCLQYCTLNQMSSDASQKWSKRALAFILRTELGIAARLGNPPPVSVFFFDKAFKAIWPEISKVLLETRFDLLWFEHSLTYPFAQRWLNEMAARQQRPFVVCNAHNVESKLQGRYADLAKSRAEADYWRLQGRLLKRLEAEAFGACDLVITCSQEDNDLAKALSPETDIRVIGNGVDTGYFRPSAGATSSSATLVFTGGFGYGPNVDALKFFVREIFPLIKAKRPDCRFLFAGANAQAAMDSLGKMDASVSCVSSPPDIRPCFEQAAVFVVPLRAGGGTRLKILEAMAMQRAIVSTRIGAEGIPCEEGEHLLLADSPSEFAEAVLRLLEDTSLRQRLGQQAGEWVRQNYDWNPLCAQAIDALKALLPKTEHILR